MISGRLRVFMNPVPMVASTLSIGKPAASAVPMAVTITTFMGLKRSTKPATMMATPISGQRLTSVNMLISP